MWGNIILEYSYYGNFFSSFPDTNNKILVMLLHWQYWWWFWFSSLISIYYILILKYVSYRNFKFFPKIVTSVKSHGKWGDLIIAILPITWCLNILINSNLLLRLYEWQVESGSFILRVRGKQWYWIYKIDIKPFINYLLNDKQYTKLSNNSIITNNSLYMDHKMTYYKNNISYSNDNVKSDQLKLNKYYIYSGFYTNLFKDYNYVNINNNYYYLNYSISNNIKHTNITNFYSYNFSIYFFEKNKKLSLFRDFLIKNDSFHRPLKFNNIINYNYNFGINKNILNKQILIKQMALFDFKKNDNLVSDNRYIENYNYTFDLSNYNKNRLIKTNIILALPINTNISIISNSFDVVHSWFIPGLGLKIDCVPGRSTHSMLRISVCGLYYGHCAEVCGRMHHHMPIKICSLPNIHFINWVFSFLQVKKINLF